MNIFSKLLLTLLFTSLILLSIIYWVVQWSFDRGMLEYVNQKELQSLQLLADNLSKYYQQNNDWQGLLAHSGSLKQVQFKNLNNKQTRFSSHVPSVVAKKNNITGSNPNSIWHQIVVLSSDEHIFPADVNRYLIENVINDDRQLSQRRGPERRDFNVPPPPRTEKRIRHEDHRRHNGDDKRPPPPRKRHPEEQKMRPDKAPPPPKVHPQGMLLPTLLNSNKRVVIGRMDEKFSLKPIILQGKTIGYIALAPKQHLSDAFDLSFIKESQQNFIFTFLLLFILLAIIAVLLSRHFVTPIKYLERQIRLLNKGEYQVKIDVKGKDELSSLSLNFNDLAQTLEQNKNSRDAWLANISHELRTPVAIIKAEIEAMQDGIRAFNIGALVSLVSLAEEVNHLQKLIDDLSTLSNAEIGAMRYQKNKVNLATLLDANLARHQIKANTLNIQLTLNIESKKCGIWADETRINQLIDNLLNNCFKYTQIPGHIIIRLRKEKNSAILTIDDSFPSVPNEALGKLFDHLYRVESSRNRKTGGSGIGLALCKNIVYAHQGEIVANHSDLGGLSIGCTLPLMK